MAYLTKEQVTLQFERELLPLIIETYGYRLDDFELAWELFLVDLNKNSRIGEHGMDTWKLPKHLKEKCI
jgi:hypothetical protein